MLISQLAMYKMTYNRHRTQNRELLVKRACVICATKIQSLTDETDLKSVTKPLFCSQAILDSSVTATNLQDVAQRTRLATAKVTKTHT